MSSSGLHRNPIDKYYTSGPVIDLCKTYLEKSHNIRENDFVIEPSAGNGSFIPILEQLNCPYKMYDIQPDHPDIIKEDFLNVTKKDILECAATVNTEFSGKIHVIGNPPFGRQSSTAIKFIKHAATFCDTISFILPKSFQKESMIKKIPPLFHCILNEAIPYQGFIFNGEPYDVPCVFQIWIKRDNPREVPETMKACGFHFVKKDESPDISFRRVGVYAGKIDTIILDKSPQSHYFIKFDVPFDSSLYEKLKTLSFDKKDHTVGPRSISKPELIEEYNRTIHLIS